MIDPKEEATNQQLKASDPSFSAWVCASAGSGKTKVLSDRVLRLLLTGAAPEKILCLTFTRSAAAEMCNRLTARLADWATKDDAGLDGELAKLNVPAGKRDAARRLFARILDTPGGLKIMTIHAFCQSLLRRFPVEAGVAPEFEIADERQTADLLSQAQDDVLSDPAYAGDLAEIVPVTDEKGFTDVMNDLKADLPSLNHFLTEYKTEKDRRRAYEKAFGLPENADEKTLERDFRTLAPERREDLRRCAETLGRSKTKTSLEKAAVIGDFLAGNGTLGAYLSAFLTKSGEITQKLVTNDAADVKPEMTREAERARTLFNDLKSLPLVRLSTALVRIGKALTERYAALKNGLSLLDYDDLIAKTVRLLETSEDAAWVLYKLDGGIDHVLVDEAQDTSPAQWRIVKALTDEFFSGEGARPAGRTLFVVGDRKQSIYSFQGADPDEFDRMKKYFSAKIGETFRDVPMHVSFRSTPAVIDAVNKTLANPDAKKDVLSADEDAVHLCARKGTGGTVELSGLVESRKADEIPYTKPVEKRTSEKSSKAETAEAVAKKIESLIGNALLPTGKTVAAGDILVLVRRRNAFIDTLTRELKARGIPVSGADRLKITDDIAVRDLMALGDFLLLPEDDLALAQVLRSPSPLGKARALLEDLLKKVDSMRPFELYTYVLDTLGKRKAFVRRLGAQALDAIDEFVTLAAAFDMKNPPSLQLFLRMLRENDIEIKRDSAQKTDAVRIMTVHASKGLEAPVVFLPDTRQVPRTTGTLFRFDGGLPVWTPDASFRNRQTVEKLTEKKNREQGEYRRLLYVAMTRPRDRLYVTGWENKTKATEGNWYDLIDRSMEGRSLDYPCETAEPAKQTEADETADAPLPEWAKRKAPADDPAEKPYAPSHENDDETVYESPLAPDRAKARFNGDLVHKLLEILPDYPAEKQREAALTFLAAQKGDETLADKVLAIVRDPAFFPLFGEGSAAEASVSGKTGGRFFAGRIDRIAVSETDVRIVDYKSGRHVPEPGGKIPDSHLAQMKCYADLLHEIHPEKKIRCYILWTEVPRLDDISAQVGY